MMCNAMQSRPGAHSCVTIGHAIIVRCALGLDLASASAFYAFHLYCLLRVPECLELEECAAFRLASIHDPLLYCVFRLCALGSFSSAPVCSHQLPWQTLAPSRPGGASNWLSRARSRQTRSLHMMPCSSSSRTRASSLLSSPRPPLPWQEGAPSCRALALLSLAQWARTWPTAVLARLPAPARQAQD